MYALVEDNSISKIITNPKSMVIGDVRYPAKIFQLWSESELNAIGIFQVITDSTNKKDEAYYINTNEQFDYANNQVTRSWGTATPKRLEDENAVDEDGKNILDDDGNQVINYGLKTEKKRIVKQQALTSSSNAVAWDTQAKPNAYHLTTENTTFSAPTNSVEGSFICLEINYNGSHTIAFNTAFEFAASTAPTFTSTDGKTDILVFKYNGSVWQEVGRTLNLSES